MTVQKHTIYTSTILEFSPTAAGAATPLKTIAGTNTLLALAEGMRSDAAGNLYVINVIGTGTPRSYSVEQFAASATGNAAPAALTTATLFTNGGPQLALR